MNEMKFWAIRRTGINRTWLHSGQHVTVVPGVGLGHPADAQDPAADPLRLEPFKPAIDALPDLPDHAGVNIQARHREHTDRLGEFGVTLVRFYRA
jgi:hypothetical protein